MTKYIMVLKDGRYAPIQGSMILALDDDDLLRTDITDPVERKKIAHDAIRNGRVRLVRTYDSDSIVSTPHDQDSWSYSPEL